MKRPLGVIGLVYLSALAVFFYFHDSFLTPLLCICATAAVVAAVFWKLYKRDSRLPVTIIVVGLTALAAALSLTGYRACKCDPIVNDYSDKEILVEGYVMDDLHIKEKVTVFTVQTEKINSEQRGCKIGCTYMGKIDLQPFDCVKIHMTPTVNNNAYSQSRGVFLTAFGLKSDITATGEKHSSLYAVAVDARNRIKESFDRWLDPNAAGLCTAVLLGDKTSLSSDVREAFTKTGVSYLIVVSGMHLMIVTLLLRLLLRKLQLNDLISAVAVIAFIICFSAVTGFSPSVIRAGIMLSLVYIAPVVYRESDSINSLGIAALALTVPNPFSVGNVGLLLSFAATFGILLWSDKLYAFSINALHLSSPSRRKRTGIKQRVLWLVRWAIKSVLRFICASVSATLWVIPFTVLFFESISPLTVLISCIAYPLTFVVLLFALLSAIIALLGIQFMPFAPLINTLSAWLVDFVRWCAELPFCQVIADDVYWYVWLAVSVVLVTVGYCVHAQKTYVFTAIITSVLTLTIGASLTSLLSRPSADFFLIRSGSGYSAAVRRGENLSLLSCGGSSRGLSILQKQMKRTQRIDNILLTNSRQGSLAYLGNLTAEYDIGNILMYAPEYDSEVVSAEDVRLFDDNTSFTLELNSEVRVKVFAIHGMVCRLVSSDNASVLLLPGKADADTLPEEMLKANLVVLEGSAENLSLFDHAKVISVSGRNQTEAELVPTGEVIEFKL